MAIERDMKLLTASDVAELCEVDLKTIHNWVERGCIPHFRTPGRHLRFQAVDVARFLREWGYAIPRRFYAEIAQSIVVVGGKEATGFVTRAAGQTVAVHGVDDLYHALLHIGAEPTSAVVIDSALAQAWPEMVVPAISALNRAFSSLTVVWLGDDPQNLADRHDLSVVPSGDSRLLRAALTEEAQPKEQAVAPVEKPKRKVRKTL
jgi:excisionase family DNA binding protein